MEGPTESGASLTQLQALVDAWIRGRGRYWSPLSQYARLAEEVGELGRELNHRFGDKPRTRKDAIHTVDEELGDVLFILLALANTLRIDLDAALQQTLQKYSLRSPAVSPGRG